MTNPQETLDAEDSIQSVLDAKTEKFADLMAIAGLDLRSDLAGADLTGVNFGGEDLRSVNLSNAVLRGANLSRADLTSANLSGADLREADLSGANLAHANLKNADLRALDFSDTELEGADISGADFRRTTGVTMMDGRHGGEYPGVAAGRRDRSLRPHKAKIIQMYEPLERPEWLRGTTYKITTPVTDHALYVTINDVIAGGSKEEPVYRPFEMFINSKNLDNYQWLVTVTRLISAVFRRGGDIGFVVDELKAVFDPRGGYWKPGGKFMPSIVAEIGDVIQTHLKRIGLLAEPADEAEHARFLEEARIDFEKRSEQQELTVEGDTSVADELDAD